MRVIKQQSKWSPTIYLFKFEAERKKLSHFKFSKDTARGNIMI